MPPLKFYLNCCRNAFRGCLILKAEAAATNRICFLSTKNDSLNDTIKKKSFGKFSEFKDDDSTVIFDVEEEKMKFLGETSNTADGEEAKQEVILRRGETGVFDVEELVDLLKENKAIDIFVANVSPELQYVDHIVITTVHSRRHHFALAEVVRKVFKKKMNTSDYLPNPIGEDPEWLAMDLGNIALHIMSKRARRIYDLESLWGIGAKYDLILNKAEDDLIQLLKKHVISLDDLHPANDKIT